MLQPVCFLGLAILTTNAIETAKCDNYLRTLILDKTRFANKLFNYSLYTHETS